MPTGEPLPEGWQGAWFTAYGAGASVTKACELAGIGESTFYAAKARDERIQAAYREAKSLRRDLRRNRVEDKLHLIAEDDADKRQFDALKLLFERAAPDDSKGADADGIAEAIDRFTQLVAGAITARELQEPSTLQAALASGGPLTEREG